MEYNPLSIEGIVEIAHDLWVKKEGSKPLLFDHLSQLGYKLKEDSEEKKESKENPSSWFFTLSKEVLQRKAICGSCKQLIESRGIQAHNHKCEKCGATTYLHFVPGSSIEFYPPSENSRDSLALVIHSYDEQKKEIRFFKDPRECPKIIKFGFEYKQERMSRTYENLEKILKENPELKEMEIEGKKVIAIKYDASSPYVQEHSINTVEFSGEQHNFSSVNVFNGKVLGLWDELPCPDSITVIKAWDTPLLVPGQEAYKEIMHAARQVSRKDFYHQDGRPAFNQIQIDWMLTYIENFTTFDVKKIKPYLTTRLSGPGLIDTLAALTGHGGHIPTEANIGNTLTFLGKVMDGKPVSKNEYDAALTGRFFGDGCEVIDKIIDPDTTNNLFNEAQERFYGNKKKKKSR